MRDIVILYNFLRGGCRKARQESSGRKREDGLKLCQGGFKEDIRKKKLTKRVAKYCNRLPREVGGSLSLELRQVKPVKSQADMALLDMVVLVWWYLTKAWT